jgi:hypothetical protein
MLIAIARIGSSGATPPPFIPQQDRYQRVRNRRHSGISGQRDQHHQADRRQQRSGADILLPGVVRMPEDGDGVRLQFAKAAAQTQLYFRGGANAAKQKEAVLKPGRMQRLGRLRRDLGRDIKPDDLTPDG